MYKLLFFLIINIFFIECRTIREGDDPFIIVDNKNKDFITRKKKCEDTGGTWNINFSACDYPSGQSINSHLK